MDFENDIVHEEGKFKAWGIPEEVKKQHALENTKKVLDRAREIGINIVYIIVGFSKDYKELKGNKTPIAAVYPSLQALHLEEWGTQVHAMLKPKETETVFIKHRINPFTHPGLKQYFQKHKIKTFILTGVATNFVVESTARQASDEDYEVIVIEDCCASKSKEMHDFSIQNILPTLGSVIKAADVLKILK